LGADSTTTVLVPDPSAQQTSVHHYTFGQKVFEFGPEGSTLGIVTWGLGSLGLLSYRTLFAEVADEAQNQALEELSQVASFWSQVFWERYRNAFGSQIDRVHELRRKGNARTEEEQKELDWFRMNYACGFCLGGRWRDRHPGAFEIQFHPLLSKAPPVEALQIGIPKFWGCPNLIDRLVFGIDADLFRLICESEKWTGSNDDLVGLVSQRVLGSPKDLPIREAVDLVYANIYTTIKGMKFSHLSPVCGGPIEVAVITTDRPFRWVCHKEMCQAISERAFLKGTP